MKRLGLLFIILGVVFGVTLFAYAGDIEIEKINSYCLTLSVINDVDLEVSVDPVKWCKINQTRSYYYVKSVFETDPELVVSCASNFKNKFGSYNWQAVQYCLGN